jgi:predicted Zn-dependent protease with MMP-like domain
MSTRPCSRSRCVDVRFDDVVREALDSLPPHLEPALRNVAIVVEDENAEEPDLYGLFDGVPLTEGGPAPGELPNRIAIYRRPLETDFDDRDELREEIRITVLHELGHYFGLDEERLAELGYE